MSPDGTKIVFDRYEPSGHHIRTINADGSDMSPRLTEGGGDTYPAWSRRAHVVSALYAGGGSFGMSVSPPLVLAVP